MNTANCLSRIEETYPLTPVEGEASYLAILRESVITAVRLHLILRADDDKVTSAHIQNLINAVQQIYTVALCRIPEIYESYGTIIRPLDLLKEQIQYSEPTPVEPALQSIYAEPADPLGHHPHTQTGGHFGEMSAGTGETDHHKSA
ncbi:hypothetical protein K8942_00250 [Candidatus Peribacteria bacterium]|nr:MAG: hypothetical protein K8942_00250 [Candidatus Peribacteria bacterium]